MKAGERYVLVLIAAYRAGLPRDLCRWLASDAAVDIHAIYAKSKEGT